MPVSQSQRRTRSAAHLLIALLLALSSLLTPSITQAASATRTSAFAYDASGLLIKEVIEPGNSDLCLVTEYTYDTYGNKTSASTRNCIGAAINNGSKNTWGQVL